MSLFLSLALFAAVAVFLWRRYSPERSAEEIVVPKALGKSTSPASVTLMKLPEDTEAAFLMCTFSILGKLVEVDGGVCKEEEEQVKRYISETLGLQGKTGSLALRVFHQAASSPLDVNDYAEKFRQSFPDEIQLYDRMIDTLVAVAAADGSMSPQEDDTIRGVALELGLSEPGYHRIRAKYVAYQPTMH